MSARQDRGVLRAQRPRPKTLSLRSWSKREIEEGRAAHSSGGLPERPKTRGECADVPRPCPFVSCRHHLYLETKPNGSVMLNFPDIEPGEMKHSCSLDLADRSARSVDELGTALNVSFARVQQIESGALVKIRASENGAALEQYMTPEQPPALIDARTLTSHLN